MLDGTRRVNHGREVKLAEKCEPILKTNIVSRTAGHLNFAVCFCREVSSKTHTKTHTNTGTPTKSRAFTGQSENNKFKLTPLCVAVGGQWLKLPLELPRSERRPRI